MKVKLLIKDKELCVELNQEISIHRLAKFTWGNASVRSGDTIIIKPSGVPFNHLEPSAMSVVELDTGRHLSGLKPSVDTNIHLQIYRSFKNTKSVMHTHSKYATMFAQAKMPIPLIGTTHADYFPCDIPLTDQISLNLNNGTSMEEKMGREVVQVAKGNFPDGCETCAVLMMSHGVMVWNSDPTKLLESAIILEEIAELAYGSIMLNPATNTAASDVALFKFHYNRKHGKDKSYGQ
jgi:L-ribulose-5-phosphate 4-epimerase